MARGFVARNSGFTLSELMIVVAIIGILLTIGIPSYENYLDRARRSDAIGALQDIANRIERYNYANNSYTGATLTNVYNGDTETPDGYYDLTLTIDSAVRYTVVAAPKGPQADDRCGDFVLNSLGEKTIQNAATGVTAESCWKR